nr:MAK10-like protein [Tanacetum cinerariifolium]
MGDENPIHTLRDYSKPSHEGYKNTIKLPVGNNVVPLRFDTIRLVQHGCSFHGLRSEDPNQHLKDFIKLVDSLDLDGENKERTARLTAPPAANSAIRIPANIGKSSRTSLYFVILKIKEDEKRPFILGTPFLTMAKAVIKFDKGTITLRSGKSKISFHRIPESRCKIEKVVKNDIKPITPTMTINRLVLEWEERIKLHLERKMEFDQ